MTDMNDFNGTLPNGVELYTCLNPGLTTFSLNLWVRHGAMHDAPEAQGLAHFLEHAVFRSLSERLNGELYALLYANGLDFTATTSDAYVRFEMNGPAEAFDLGLELLLRVLEPPRLSLEGLNRERLRIQAEIRENDSAGSYDQFARSWVWRDTPLARTIEGSANRANRVGFDALAGEHTRWFTRGGFFFCAAGHVPDPEALRARLAALEVPAPDPGAAAWSYPVPEAFFHRDGAVHFWDQRTPHLVFCFDVDAVACSPAALNLAQEYLLHDDGALYLALSEDAGLCYGIDGYLQYHGPVAGLTFDFDVEPANVEAGVRATVNCLNAAKSAPDDGLLAFRRGFLSLERQRADDPAGRAYNWGLENGILGCGWQTPAQRLAAYGAVTPEALRQTFRRLFTPDNATLCACGSPRRVDTEALREILLDLKNP